MTFSVGFIGFGEVASHFASRLVENGCVVYVYDLVADTEEGMAALQKKIGQVPVTVVKHEDLYTDSQYIFSTVVTQVAVKVAQRSAQYLRSDHYYVDLNSASPSVKNDIAQIIESSGAKFVEGAILGALGATGADTKILLGGKHAAHSSELLRSRGLNAHFFSQIIGKASTFKMVRSVFSKGIEALLIESMLAASQAEIEDELWADIIQTLTKTPFEKTAANWIISHVAACDRRYYEMLQVIDTLNEIKIAPLATNGTVAFFERSAAIQLTKKSAERTITSVSDAIEALRGAIVGNR